MSAMQIPAISPALAAIVGSMTGALGSSLSTWITQRHADRRDLLARRLFHREQLYSDFIIECTRIVADALENSFKDPHKLIPVYALLSRVRLSASTEVLASAELLIRDIVKIYNEPNLTPQEIQSRALNGGERDPLKHFSELCRAELDSMGGRL
ncbi:MAG: hypothetical protein ABSA57_19765 [Candidatus Acidiferrales bacterium]|jgi:hypothetical protein